MIVQLIGKVTYPITLDPTVWIFDDRKILFGDAFLTKERSTNSESNELKEASLRWDREVSQQRIKPPVNKSISRFEQKKILEGTYVMPIKYFLEHAEILSDAKGVRLETDTGSVEINLEQLSNCYLLFAQEGTIVKDRGPVHLYFHDGSNYDAPIKGIKKIVIE